MSRLMGGSKFFFGSLKKRKRGPLLEDIFRLAAATRLPEFVVFGRLFPVPARPADLLRQLEKSRSGLQKDGPKDDVVLPAPLCRLAKAWDGLANKNLAVVVPKKARWSSRKRLNWIDELRHRDPAEGLRFTECELTTLLAQLDASKAPEPGVLGELAVATAMWADTQRGAGNFELALLALPWALDYAEKSEERWALAHCLWLGALLLHDLGYTDFALPWTDRAGGLFAHGHQLARLPELLVTQGQLLVALGRYTQGRTTLLEALCLLPEDDHRWRHPARLELAAAEHGTRRPQAALAQLELLAKEYTAQDAFQASMEWRKAAALLATGETAQGIAAFSNAAALISTFGRISDVGYILCDFAEYLLEIGHAVKVSGLTAEIRIRWGRKAPCRRLAVVVEDFYALSRLRPLTATDIARTRKKLKELGPPPRRSFPTA